MFAISVAKSTDRLCIATLVALQCAVVCIAGEAPPDFTTHIAPIFAKYCAGCHNATDLEGDLSLETFADLQKGGSRGPAIVPGRADASLLVRVLTGEVEPKMPPEDNERPADADIALLRAWIDAGAKGPAGAEPAYPELSTPEIAAAANVTAYVGSLALSPDGKLLALGRYRHVDLIDPATRKVLATTPHLPGKVNNISFSADGATVVAASGVAGLYGVATICRASDATVISQVKGHRDALYDARLSPDEKVLATCSYDRQINLWNPADGKLLRTLTGHNGAVFELAFSKDGTVLVTASADGTVKLWKVATGERLDTLGQPEGGQNAVAITPDDGWILAAGADRQLRKWRFVSRDRAEINPLVTSRIAHDGAVVELSVSRDGTKLATASEGRELMLWDAKSLTPLHNFEQQPDVVTGIAFDATNSGIYVARIDGSWQRYDIDAAWHAQRLGDRRGEPASPTDPMPIVTIQNIPRLEREEQEPNNTPHTANEITANAVARGIISASGEVASATGPTGAARNTTDADLYRFKAVRGQQIIFETNAARQKSPLDSKLEVLDAAGKPIPRTLLQAVRETYFTFRGHNSTDANDFRLHGWEDMELNEYLYANGEVVKLWLYPRGPDSGFIIYPGFAAPRYTYFGTTAITHPLNEPGYIVEAHPPDAQLIPNGLPQYTLYFENDDDGWRKLGADSRIVFTAPADGEYIVRVSDVRDMGGDDYKYELIARAPVADFTVKIAAPDLTINAGSGKEFSVVADRADDFEGEILLAVTDLPPGFHCSTPLVIEAGQTTAFGTITADADAPALTPENSKLAKLTATAKINGREVKKDPAPLGELKLAEKPKILVRVYPDEAAANAATSAADANAKPVEVTIAPGQTISAVVKVERNGYDGEIGFGGDLSGRNLPHGVFVDNIGLNGLTLLQGETQRKFFITAAKFVPETTRAFHLKAEVEGNQTSLPIHLHIRRPADTAAPTQDKVAAAPSASK
jgi:hypothetical protein